MFANQKLPIIIALDYPDLRAAEELISQLNPKQHRVKVGKIMFTRFGPTFVKSLVNRGYDVFLDLKFHDIPNTVSEACKAAQDLGVWMLTLHALGGHKMCLAAREAINSSQQKPLLVAVTILTHLTDADLNSVGLSGNVESNVKNLALLAQGCHLDGVVCSAKETFMLREIVNKDFSLVTPGIRLPSDKPDDQARTVTPDMAIKMGANYLVIGRPITQAQNPLAIIQQISIDIKKEFVT